MRKLAVTITCLVFLCVPGKNLFAQNTAGQEGTRTITTAVPFLLVAPDSRAGGMGEAGVAVTDDANALHWNASAMAFFENQLGFSMSYSPWLRSLGIPDINLMYLSGYYNAGEKAGVIGASLRYFSLGDIEFTDGLGQPIGSDKPNEFAVDVGYARKVTPNLSAAVTLRYIYSRLASNANIGQPINPVNSIAGDLSFLYNTDFSLSGSPINFKAGLNISNIGPKVSYTDNTADQDFIPVNLRIGYAFKVQVDDYNSITFTNDFNKLLVPSEGGNSDQALLQGIFGSFGDATGGFSEEVSEINVSAGFEYWYRDLFAARVGYFYEDPNKGNRQFITLGAGIKYNVFGLHFAYLAPLEQNHPLQNTLRFTLTYDFAPVEETE
ncbi:MAG: type IX secretion system outer membrane channel protein PorV [Bacteroidota bacterium]